MTVFKGANATNRDAEPSVKSGVGDSAGVRRSAFDSYTFSAIIDTTDTLELCLIPKGARVLNVTMVCDDLGTTGDFNIGWKASAELDSSGSAVEAADADGFGVAVDVNAAASVYEMKDQTGLAGMHKKFDAEVQLQITPSEITTATSGDLSIEVEYVIE